MLNYKVKDFLPQLLQDKNVRRLSTGMLTSPRTDKRASNQLWGGKTGCVCECVRVKLSRNVFLQKASRCSHTAVLLCPSGLQALRPGLVLLQGDEVRLPAAVLRVRGGRQRDAWRPPSPAGGHLPGNSPCRAAATQGWLNEHEGIR